MQAQYTVAGTFWDLGILGISIKEGSIDIEVKIK